MKINLLSDIHLEFAFYDAGEISGDVLILAGDIGVGLQGVKWGSAFTDGMPKIYVAGNHEYYRNIFPDNLEEMKKFAEGKKDFYFLENDSVVINGVRFIGATLWTDFDLNHDKVFSMLRAPEYMNDYRSIRERVEDGLIRLRPNTILKEFEHSKDYLIETLKEEFDGPTVVITHHGPTEESIHFRFKTQSGNEYFASNLEDMILEFQPEVWVHGHTHDSVNYTVGKTRVYTNPRGYHNYGKTENNFFVKDFIIDV